MHFPCPSVEPRAGSVVLHLLHWILKCCLQVQSSHIKCLDSNGLPDEVLASAALGYLYVGEKNWCNTAATQACCVLIESSRISRLSLWSCKTHSDTLSCDLLHYFDESIFNFNRDFIITLFGHIPTKWLSGNWTRQLKAVHIDFPSLVVFMVTFGIRSLMLWVLWCLCLSSA